MEWRVALAALLALAGCGKEPAPRVDPGSRMEDAAKQAGEAAKSADVRKFGDAMAKMGDAFAVGTKVEPVDFRELKALLPESVAGLKRVNDEGSRTSVVGVATSKALASYEDGKGAKLSLELIDAGTFTGVASLAFAWLDVEIDKEGDDGYERTSTLEGRRAYERYSRKDRSGELDVMVAGRFLVSARASGLEMKAFREAIGKLDYAKLDALKGKAAASGAKK